jgi:N-6 DNA Methylase/TaqI-like C-terminal specificity domain
VPAPATVIELVERFDRQRDAYRSGDYNEARLRKEFLDPFFGALGWDMENRQGYAEPYKDVIHEDSIKVGGGTKAPDYCFRVGPMRKFFVEAKKPAVNIKEDVSPAYQLRRYAWTAKLPLSILTDFEEFAVYDCRIRPHVEDKASVARTLYLTFDEYLDRWDDIARTFSKDAVLKGSFDSYAEKGRGKRGTTEVDDAFLEEIEGWRERLARNLAERNPALTQHDLNFAVQRTIDRIVFLRICEDRGVEEYERLRSIVKGPDVYHRLLDRFRLADERYNSGLFHFTRERDRAEAHDELTPDLQIDDKVLRDILDSLYYPASPYEFSVLPVDILGHVYERFLGKVIRLTPAHRAKIEEKPEVRKAGGVYYTPSYIVDYIVRNTVGKALEGRVPDEGKAVRVVDPACGSGSFLLGAYQYLLDWHLEQYEKDDPAKLSRQRQPPVFRGRHGEWRLTAQKKKQILLDSIFGVDLDAQAIEVSKLSLLLKVLEGETDETVNAALKLFHDRALPDLGRNIRHGNSLVAPDYRTFGQLTIPALEEDELSPFDWSDAFPKVFADGGFDVVIGNPPYLSFAGRQAIEIPDKLRNYYNEKYESAGWPTAHSLFFERALRRISNRFVAFIVPDQLGHLAGYGSIREIASREGGLAEVRYWGERVFKGVTTPALTFVVDKSRHGCQTSIFGRDGSESSGVVAGMQEWVFSPSADLLRRLRTDAFSLGELVGDFGIRTTAAKEQVVDLADARGKVLPALEGKRVQRYVCEPPEIGVRLDSRKPLHGTTNEGRFKAAVFLIRQTAAFPIVGPHEHATHFRNSLLGLFAPTDGLHVNYLVALLNSRLMRFLYMESTREAQQRTFPQVKLAALRALPMRKIDLASTADKERHDELVRLVDDALQTQKRTTKEKNPIRKEAIQHTFQQLDRDIDRRVFELYGLSVEEIGLVDRRLASLLPEGERPKSWRPEASGPVSGPKPTRGELTKKRKVASGNDN